MARSATSPKPSAAKPHTSKRTPCTGRHGKRHVSLPILSPGKPPPLRASKASRWRALVLFGVYLLMAAHYFHWLRAGSTLTPVEPSESMETLREGRINAGFIFFGATILATIVLGRFFCGWGCHIVALQDATAWALKKIKLRPKAFRSRLLLFVPLFAAIYMFGLPLADRLYVKHWVGRQVAPFALHLTRTGFWDTFPGPLVAILTVLFCGVIVVYFLGPKGFCTYACPYGSIFALSDKISPGRIRVTDACEGCGHCTATCTSNVDVAREVRLYGMVVDPGCMKCMDCISVCPNDALYYGFGKLPIGLTPTEPPHPRRWDLTWTEEIAALVIFAAFFLCYRGIYGGMIPFLFALGLAGIGTYISMRFAQLFYAPDVAVQRIRLKIGGHVTRLGAAYCVAFIALAGLTVHSGVWQWHRFAAERAFEQCPAELLGWQFDPKYFEKIGREPRAAAQRGLAHAEWCENWGLLPAIDLETLLAWTSLSAGESARAAGHLQKAIALAPNDPNYRLSLARVQVFLGDDARAQAAFADAIRIESRDREALTRKVGHAVHPASAAIWTEWGAYLTHHDRLAEADAAFRNATEFNADYYPGWLSWAGLQLRGGRIDDARRSLIRAVELQPGHVEAAAALIAAGREDHQDFTAAAADYRAAIARHPDEPVFYRNLGYVLIVLKDYDAAVAACRQAVTLRPDSPDVHAEYGAMLLTVGDVPGATAEYEFVVRRVPLNAEACFRLASLYEQAGRFSDAIRLYETADHIETQGPLHDAAAEAYARLRAAAKVGASGG